MISPRLYEMEPPPLRTMSDDKPTLLVSWWCTGFAFTIIMFRLCGRFIRTEKLFREDKIMALAIIPLFLRMGMVHVVLHWGTNNTVTAGLTPLQIHHREIGSGMVLGSRVMYAAILWIEKWTVCEFFKRITGSFWKRSYEIGIQFLRWFLVVTFIAVVISNFTECRPTHHYWQVVPDPGPRCRQGYAQLLTMGTLDVITDLLLVCFPIPIILRSSMRAMRKFELILLFALSLIPIGVALYRVPSIVNHDGRQQIRSLWASVEVLLATAVTNALVLGSFVRDRGPKKMRFKFGSTSDSLSRPGTRRDINRTDTYWGSDEDLVRGTGMNVEPELRGEETEQVARPAPVALPAKPVSKRPPPMDLHSANWSFPSAGRSDGEAEMKVREEDMSPGEVSVLTPRKVSFFDVGGLLEDGTSRQSNSTVRTPERRPSAFSQATSWGGSHGPSRQGSHQGSNVLLHDIGGLLSGPEMRPERQPGSHRMLSRNHRNESLMSKLEEASQAERQPSQTTIVASTRRGTLQSLQDVGGLLRPSQTPQLSSLDTRTSGTCHPHHHPSPTRTLSADSHSPSSDAATLLDSQPSISGASQHRASPALPSLAEQDGTIRRGSEVPSDRSLPPYTVT
ncbi:MAG: hypothetical protein M1817_002048 [Caeruleum heppii]|nr:MAG: hypothetical protein M1817_002048 [Caeruleum heppii]